MNIQEGGSLGQRSGSATATISLTQLQAQAEQKPNNASGKQSQTQSGQTTPHLSGQEQQVTSGYFGSDTYPQADRGPFRQGSLAAPSNFEQLNFNQIDQEE